MAMSGSAFVPGTSTMPSSVNNDEWSLFETPLYQALVCDEQYVSWNQHSYFQVPPLDSSAPLGLAFSNKLAISNASAFPSLSPPTTAETQSSPWSSPTANASVMPFFQRSSTSSNGQAHGGIRNSRYQCYRPPPSRHLSCSLPPNIPVGSSTTSTRVHQSPSAVPKVSHTPSSSSLPASSASKSAQSATKERRRAQNRRAQQTLRDRRAQRVKQLEGRVEELQGIEKQLREENYRLKLELLRASNALEVLNTMLWDVGPQPQQLSKKAMTRLYSVAMWN